MSRSPVRKTLTPLAAARMQTAMQAAPHSLDTLAVVADLAKPVVTRYVNTLLTATPRLVHVGGWERDRRGYPTIRQFGWGDMPDAACPLTDRTSTTRMRARRAEQKGLQK